MPFVIIGVTEGIPPMAHPLGSYEHAIDLWKAIKTPEFRPVEGQYKHFRIRNDEGHLLDPTEFARIYLSDPPKC